MTFLKRNSNQTLVVLACVGVATLLFGCSADVTDEGGEDGRTAQVQQDIDWLTVWTWGSEGNAGPDLDVGPTSDRTCFLTGIRGSLKAWQGANGDIGDARAGVYRINGRWKVQTRTDFGPGVQVKVACIKATQGPAALGVAEGGVAYNSVPDRPNRQCFLNTLSAHGFGWAGHIFNQPDQAPWARVQKTGDSWQIRGGFAPNSGEESSGSAGAVCVDIPRTASKGFHFWSSPGNVNTHEMFTNDGQPSWVCGLTGVSGIFLDSTSSPGAEVFLNANNDWTVKVADDREVYTQCLK